MAKTRHLLRSGVLGAGQRGAESATRQALLQHAEELFAANGYTGTSLDEVVHRANVTKGALYHHFSSKRALFEAVLDAVEKRALDQITEAMAAAGDTTSRAIHGVTAFLAAATDPAYQRIVMQEGPVALGFDRWHHPQSRPTFALVQQMTDEMLAQTPYRELGNSETIARVAFGGLSSAGMAVAEADDPEVARQQVEMLIAGLIAGIQTLGVTAQTE